MEEDELLPGIGEERFEIRLGGGELNPNTDVIPEPPVEVELEGGITLTGRDEIGNEFLRGMVNDRNEQAIPTDDRVQGYYIAGHDPHYVENTNEALGAIRIQTRRAGRTIADETMMYPLEPDQVYENPFPVEETLEHLRTVALEAGLIPIDVAREQALNEAVEETRRRENEGIWHRLRREAGLLDQGAEIINPTTTAGEIYERPLAGGEGVSLGFRDDHVTGIRPRQPRNISGLKRHIEPFLEKLHMTNEINGNTFEKILEHINSY